MVSVNGTYSTASSNDWSPMSRYQNVNGSDSPYSGGQLAPRGPVASPPTSFHNSSSTMDGGYLNGGLPRNSSGNPSPPSSVGRSSDGMGLYAYSPPDGGNIRRTQVAEESLFEHYKFLKKYLSTPVNGDRGIVKPNRARDKLLRLSSIQFQELSTDVYDELLRREDERHRGGPGAPGNNTPRFLPPKRNFHPKRNQARQKLSTLPLDRFRQLASDVFFELERRIPRFGGPDIDRVGSPALSTTSSTRGGPPPTFSGPASRTNSAYRDGPPNGRNGGLPPMPDPGPGPTRGQPLGRPLPKMPQSNTIIPNKSTMVEDDDEHSAEEEEDDDDGDAFGLENAAMRQSKRHTKKGAMETERSKDSPFESSTQVAQLQEKIIDLERKLQDKDEEMERTRALEREKQAASEVDQRRWSDLKLDLERQLGDAKRLNFSLQTELNKVRSENERTEQGLRSELEAEKQKSGSDESWRQKYEDMQRELKEQEQVTDSVRRDASQFLSEMRNLSERSKKALEVEEQLNRQISQLEVEVKEWKSRYIRTKTQLRTLHASSVGLPGANSAAGLSARDTSLSDPNGLIQDVHFLKFQLSIDELLQQARSSDPNTVLNGMKSVILSVRQITQDLDEASPRSSANVGLNGDAAGNSGKPHCKIKARVAGTANNLITASKNHAAASGLSPVSLLDAAASHLATAVVDLVHAVKIRPTPAGELVDDTDSQLTFDLDGGSRRSHFGSVNGHKPGDSISSYR